MNRTGSAGVLAGESGSLFNLAGETPALPGSWAQCALENRGNPILKNVGQTGGPLHGSWN